MLGQEQLVRMDTIMKAQQKGTCMIHVWNFSVLKPLKLAVSITKGDPILLFT